jgi:FkbM family methyltransferase
VNDVIVFAPMSVAPDVVAYSRRHGADLLSLAVAASEAMRNGGGAPQQALDVQRPVEVRRLVIGSEATADPQAAQPERWGLNEGIGVVARAERLFARHLQGLGIDRVLDVGANSGQFAARLRSLGYAGTILSVEPIRDCHRELVAGTRLDPRWVALPRQAFGRESSVEELRVSRNVFSSSLLPVHRNHVEAEPDTRTVRLERIFVNAAATAIHPDVLKRVDAVKIDVQGYEDRVLEGLGGALSSVRLLMLELSLQQCYEGAPDLFSLDRRLVEEFGFERIALEPSYFDERKGVAQQYDGLYWRPGGSRGGSGGVRPGLVVTSIGGSIRRPGPGGQDVGLEWMMACAQSWKAVAPRAMSVAESAPGLPDLEWARTPSKPPLRDLLRIASEAVDAHVVLTNADISFTENLKNLLPALDEDTFYFAGRVDVELDGSGGIALRGLYEWGFDLFVVPARLLREMVRGDLMPGEFLVGEPWWDYFMPVLAMSLGYPVKKIVPSLPLVLHYAHQPNYSNELWVSNGERFREFVRVLLDRPGNPARAFLEDILEQQDADPVMRLEKVARVVCEGLP